MSATSPQRVVLQGYDFDSGQMKDFEFTGLLLGEGSSHITDHVKLVHDPGSFAAPGERCSACRWFEVRIYSVYEPVEPTHDPDVVETDTNPAGYYVETVGKTVVPGEVDRRRVRRVFQPRRLVATLVQENDGRTFVPAPSKHALDQAADRDERLAQVVDDLLVFD